MNRKKARDLASRVGLPEGTPILDMNAPNFTEQFRDAIGAKPGEEIEVVAPQFTREKGVPPPFPPPEPFESVRDRTLPELRSLGCRAWNDPAKPDPTDVKCFGEGSTLMLFPGEWYSAIPDGFEIVDISGRHEAFVRGQTDDDIRFGCLAFGVLVDRAASERQKGGE